MLLANTHFKRSSSRTGYYTCNICRKAIGNCNTKMSQHLASGCSKCPPSIKGPALQRLKALKEAKKKKKKEDAFRLLLQHRAAENKKMNNSSKLTSHCKIYICCSFCKIKIICLWFSHFLGVFARLTLCCWITYSPLDTAGMVTPPKGYTIENPLEEN